MKLFCVHDDGDAEDESPTYVVAENIEDAFFKWRKHMKKEVNMEEEGTEPEVICLVTGNVIV